MVDFEAMTKRLLKSHSEQVNVMIDRYVDAEACLRDVLEAFGDEFTVVGGTGTCAYCGGQAMDEPSDQNCPHHFRYEVVLKVRATLDRAKQIDKAATEEINALAENIKRIAKQTKEDKHV